MTDVNRVKRELLIALDTLDRDNADRDSKRILQRQLLEVAKGKLSKADFEALIANLRYIYNPMRGYSVKDLFSWPVLKKQHPSATVRTKTLPGGKLLRIGLWGRGKKKHSEALSVLTPKNNPQRESEEFIYAPYQSRLSPQQKAVMEYRVAYREFLESATDENMARLADTQEKLSKYGIDADVSGQWTREGEEASPSTPDKFTQRAIDKHVRRLKEALQEATRQNSTAYMAFIHSATDKNIERLGDTQDALDTAQRDMDEYMSKNQWRHANPSRVNPTESEYEKQIMGTLRKKSAGADTAVGLGEAVHRAQINGEIDLLAEQRLYDVLDREAVFHNKRYHGISEAVGTDEEPKEPLPIENPSSLQCVLIGAASLLGLAIVSRLSRDTTFYVKEEYNVSAHLPSCPIGLAHYNFGGVQCNCG